MEYNTQRKKMELPEYGRSVQNMVDHALTIEDREERQRCANTIVNIMGGMFPHLRDVPDFKHKLWDHLFIISGFDLDVDAPYPMPAPESLNEEPLPVPLQKRPLKAAHYGRNIENMLDLIAEHEEGEVKIAMIRTLAAYMKQQYIIWNKDTVSDATIFQDMEQLSGGRIKVPEVLKEGRIELVQGFVRQGGNGQGKKNGFKQKNNQKNRKQHNK